VKKRSRFEWLWALADSDLSGKFLTESLLLAIAGGRSGYFLRLSSQISHQPESTRIPLWAKCAYGLDGSVIHGRRFLLTGLIFGLFSGNPDIETDLNRLSKDGGRDSKSAAGSNRIRNLLVILKSRSQGFAGRSRIILKKFRQTSAD